MKRRHRLQMIALCGLTLTLFGDPEFARATQTHGTPEGLFVHQFAHIFFTLSMGILIYWLRARDLIRDQGWRYIQYAAALFILWNVDTFMVHFLDEQVDIIQITTLDNWHVKITTHPAYTGLHLVYYMAKLDHLICVPALLFLFCGLKRLYRQSADQPAQGRQP